MLKTLRGVVERKEIANRVVTDNGESRPTSALHLQVYHFFGTLAQVRAVCDEPATGYSIWRFLQ
jgi:hypothetical protein